MPTGIYAPGTGGSGPGLHPVDTRDANNQNLSRESLIRFAPTPTLVTDGLVAHYAARLETGFSDGDAVGTLTDQQNANDLTQSTSAAKPTYRDNATDNIGGNPVIEFDGTDDILTASNFLTSTAGEVIAVVRITSISANGVETLFGNMDTDGVDNKVRHRLYVGADFMSDSQPHIEQDVEVAAAGDDIVRGDTDLTASTFIMGWRSSGTAWALRVDGDDEVLTVRGGSNSGDWWGDINSPDVVTLGASETTQPSEFASAELGELLVYNRELTDSERSQDEDFLNYVVGYGVF